MRWELAKAFAVGLLAGIFLCAGLAAGLAYAVTERGFTARVDVDGVAREVRNGIELQVAEMLPGMLEEMKREVPRRVSRQLARELGTAGFVVYGVEIQLPEETMVEVRRQVRDVVAEELSRSLDEIDVASAARTWGERGQRMLVDALRRELRDRTLLLRLHPALSWPLVPVILRVN